MTTARTLTRRSLRQSPGRCTLRLLPRCYTLRPSPRLAQLGLWCALSCAWLWSARARADNDDSVPIGIEAAQTGGAITATIVAGAAGFYNPAGVAGGPSDSVDVTANAYGLRIYQVDELVRGPMGEDRGERVIDWVIAPTLLSYARRLSPTWYASFGLFVPKTTDYLLATDLNTLEGTRWFLSLQQRANQYYAGTSAAARVTNTLRLGISLLGVYAADFSSLLQAGGGLDMTTVSLIYQISSKSYGLTVRAGLQWQLRPKLAIGLSIYAPDWVIARRVDVAAAVSAPPGVTIEGRNFEIIEDTRRDGLNILGGAPGVRMGAAYVYGPGWVSLDGTLNFPLRASLPIEARKTSFNLRAGALHNLSDTWRIGGGLFTDRNPERAYGIDYYGLSFGASNTRRYDLRDGRTVGFVTSVSARYAFGGGSLAGRTVSPLAAKELQFVDHRSSTRSHELSVSVGSGISF